MQYASSPVPHIVDPLTAKGTPIRVRAPIVPRSLEPEKIEALKRDLVLLAGMAHVKDEARWQEFTTAYKALVTSTVKLLEDDTQTIHTFHKAMDEAGCAYIPHISKEQLHAENLESIESITRNRRNDAYNSLAYLNDPTFLKETFAAMTNGTLKPTPEIPPLSATRVKELADTLLPPDITLPNGEVIKGRFEPAVHIAFIAQGNQRGHAILSKVFEPQGKPGQAFVAALQKETPEVTPALAKVFAERWLQIRSTRAQQVADQYLPTSPIVIAAKEESERRRLAKGQTVEVGQAAAQAATNPAASIIAQGPRQLGERVEAPSLGIA